MSKRKNKKIIGFFGEKESFRIENQEWQGMPEFVQEDLSPYKTIYIHFEKKEDMEGFSKLVNQRITLKTKFIWFPKPKNISFMNKIYEDIDES